MKGISLRRASVASLASAIALIFAAGCGDQYRPVANPIPQSGGPQPATAGYGLVLSNTGSTTQGVVTTINLPGDTNQGQLNVGVDPTYALTPDGTRGLVASRGEDTLTFFAPVNAPLVAGVRTISLVANSSPVYIVSDGLTAWTANAGKAGKVPTVGVVSLANGSETTEVAVGNAPVALALNQAVAKVYSVNNGGNSVTVISTKDNSVLATVAVGVSPVAAVVGGGSLYVLNQGDNTVSQIDSGADTVVGTAIAVGTAPSAIAYDTARRELFVVNSGSNNVSVIDADPSSPAYRTVKATISVGTTPVALTVLADGSRAFVANSGSNDVTVIDALANRVQVPSIPVGISPMSIGSSPDSLKVIVVNKGDNTVSLIETIHYTLTKTLPVTASPVLVNTNH